jgi:hypothetical protein
VSCLVINALRRGIAMVTTTRVSVSGDRGESGLTRLTYTMGILPDLSSRGQSYM